MKSRWILLSAIMGILAAVLFVMAYKIHTPAWIIGTAAFIAGFLFFIFRNPEFWYRRMAASLIFAWIAISAIPLTAANAAVRDFFNIEVEFTPPTPIYHVGFVVIIGLLVVADYKMRTRQPVEQKTPTPSQSKKEKQETIKKVKETVTAVIERSSITQKQKSKLLSDIDFTLGQITYHLRSSRKRLTLLSPVNTAVRTPFEFKWNYKNENEQLSPQYHFTVTEIKNPQKVLYEKQLAQPELAAPKTLIEALKPDTWYAWNVRILDSENQAVTSSAAHSQKAKYRFKLFAQDEVLKPLLNELKKQSHAKPAELHTGRALIYETFELLDDALFELEQALNLNHQSDYAKNLRRRILNAQGKPEPISERRAHRA